MDGEELLQRYADGERDFSGVDLREANIRGKRGSDPILKDAVTFGVRGRQGDKEKILTPNS